MFTQIIKQQMNMIKVFRRFVAFKDNIVVPSYKSF